MADKTVPPKLLESGRLDALNRDMLLNNHTFVFLGPPENFLNRNPSSWVEAFEMYTTGLYMVYHEFGMEFLKCYCNAAIYHNNEKKFFKHIQFVENCRSALQHSGDTGYRSWAFNTLYNYVFAAGKIDFPFRNWNHFRENAEEKHWKRATEIITRDSDKLLLFLEKIAHSDSKCEKICKTVSDAFANGAYYICREVKEENPEDYRIDMFDRSLNPRFFKIAHNRLKTNHVFGIYGEDKVDAELNSLIKMNPKDFRTETDIIAGVRTPQEIKAAIIDAIVEDLKKPEDSILPDTPFDYILYVVANEIKKQLDAKHKAAILDTIAP